MTRPRYYVGLSEDLERRHVRSVFRSSTIPNEETHGADYAAAIGPFRTKRGAEFMARYGACNPHCRTVNEAERLAKRNAAPFQRYRAQIRAQKPRTS